MKYPNPIWNTNDGRRVKLQSMTNLHLLNTRRWLENTFNPWDDDEDEYPINGTAYNVAEWAEMLDREIARRVMAKAENMPLCL